MQKPGTKIPPPHSVRKLPFLWRLGALPRDVGRHQVSIYHDAWGGIAHIPPDLVVGRCRRRAGRYRGLCRYRDLLDLKVHVRIPALEDGAQFPVERSHSRL
jgi:hypothetical protein